MRLKREYENRRIRWSEICTIDRKITRYSFTIQSFQVTRSLKSPIYEILSENGQPCYTGQREIEINTNGKKYENFKQSTGSRGRSVKVSIVLSSEIISLLNSSSTNYFAVCLSLFLILSLGAVRRKSKLEQIDTIVLIDTSDDRVY